MNNCPSGHDLPIDCLIYTHQAYKSISVSYESYKSSSFVPVVLDIETNSLSFTHLFDRCKTYDILHLQFDIQASSVYIYNAPSDRIVCCNISYGVSVFRSPQPCHQYYFSEVSAVVRNVSLSSAGTESNRQCKAGQANDLYFQSRLTLNTWEFVTFV